MGHTAHWQPVGKCFISSTFSSIGLYSPKSNTTEVNWQKESNLVLWSVLQRRHISLCNESLCLSPICPFLYGNNPSGTKDTHCIIVSAVQTSNMFFSFPCFTKGPGTLFFYLLLRSMQSNFFIPKYFTIFDRYHCKRLQCLIATYWAHSADGNGRAVTIWNNVRISEVKLIPIHSSCRAYSLSRR